jgi:hypothetical protein
MVMFHSFSIVYPLKMVIYPLKMVITHIVLAQQPTGCATHIRVARKVWSPSSAMRADDF